MPKISKKIESHQKDFDEIYRMIVEVQSKFRGAINTQLIQLYWGIGKYIFYKTQGGWGKSTVQELADHIQSRHLPAKGFSARNIWRMKQFFETYEDYPELTGVLAEISWTNHFHILSKTKTLAKKKYYLTLASKNRYSERGMSRLIDSGAFERTLLADKKLSAALTVFPAEIKGDFKDSYVFEFLSLPDNHLEDDLRKALLAHLKQLLLELGPDFTLMGEEYVIQVGIKNL